MIFKEKSFIELGIRSLEYNFRNIFIFLLIQVHNGFMELKETLFMKYLVLSEILMIQKVFLLNLAYLNFIPNHKL